MFGKKKPDRDQFEGRKLFRCSFCNKSQRDVRKLIAGPTVYICDECVDVCFQVLNSDAEYEPASASSPSVPDIAVNCCLCRLATLPTAAVILPGRGALCSACATAVAEAVAEKEQPPN